MFKIVVIILAVLNVMPQHVSSVDPIITGAVIGASITASGTIGGGLISKTNTNVQPGEKGGCHWKGTAPFCKGRCNRNVGEEEYIRHKQNCLTGKKALCCKGREHDNTWDGVWEVAYTFTIQRCKNIEDQSNAACGMNLKCIDDNDNEYTWEIGGSNCDRLFWYGTEDAEVYPGIIAWEKSGPVAWPTIHGKARKWYKVNPGS